MSETRSKSPWWQISRSPRLGFIIGVIYLLAGVLAWVNLVISDSHHLLEAVVAVGFSFLALAYIGSAAATQRRRLNQRAD